MLELDRPLFERLEALRVRIDIPDNDTVILRGVPLNQRLFSKPTTNVLIKRPGADLPFVVCVDEDVDYTGEDPSLARVFAGGVKQQGWRILMPVRGLQKDFQTTVEDALAALGFGGEEPRSGRVGAESDAEAPGNLLTIFGTNLSQLAREGKTQPTVGRDDLIDEVLSCLLRWGSERMPVIVGESGVGKTNALHAVAVRLAPHRPELDLVSLDLVALFAGAAFEAEQENLLATLLEQAAACPETILALEHVHLVLALPRTNLLLSQFLDTGRALMGTMLPAYRERLDREVLARRLTAVELPEMGLAETLEVLRTLSVRIAAYHKVEISQSCFQTCVRLAQGLSGHFPAKAIQLLDATASRASLAGTQVVGPDDLHFAASRCVSSE